MVKLEQFMSDFIDPLQSLPPLLKIAMSLSAIGVPYFEWFCFRNVPETFVSLKKKKKAYFSDITFSDVYT